MAKKVFIGAAWPYANNSMHLGHVAALIGGDVLARYHRLKGDEVLYVSGSDCYGTPIAVEAEKRGIDPEEIARKYDNEFRQTLCEDLGFSYDIFTNTLTQNHREIVQNNFKNLLAKEKIEEKEVELPYCESCQRFLPDRYIEGECPNCNFKDARGDQCDNCGSILDPKDLVNPRCKACGGRPIFKKSKHFFLKLAEIEPQIKEFISNSSGWRPNAKNFSLKFVEGGLHDRAITRDLEWGINIPIEGYEEKKIYVWFEAVTGYLSASIEWAKESAEEKKWEDFWKDNDAVHYYVHGKDNIPFHTIIWPAILMGLGELKLPDIIVSSEYLTLEGSQFSKSRKHAVWLPDFLKEFDSETLRYYLIANGPETSDADFSWDAFRDKTNNELIGNFANFINRTLSLIKNNFPDGLDFKGEYSEQQNELLSNAVTAHEEIGKKIESTNFRDALKTIFSLAENGNRYLNKNEPWKKIKTDRSEAEKDLLALANVILAICSLIEPFLPKTAKKIAQSVGLESLAWSFGPLDRVAVGDLSLLFEKLEDDKIEEQKEKLKK
ncbi:MAG: Methionine--tRNA ligase [candidate division WS2 bacterium ADurb.Bin280]|uniref:Methionine--tRNA ligase n=1 Tax=candidate division WS2 bacterium ADurb.Bin280 TaxID=1852829 RepID=A0A1V5SGG0_9BACT|nr:MAG: Methionine--tRNA ligase [candidate division WS2 bacterium ADurb.Bin280]